MAIEIVDLPIKTGDFPYSYVSLPEGSCPLCHFLKHRLYKVQSVFGVFIENMWAHSYTD